MESKKWRVEIEGISLLKQNTVSKLLCIGLLKQNTVSKIF